MDLDRYLRRIGLDVRPLPNAAGLAALQRAQRLAIGFENLDIPLGRGIAIDSATVFEKLVVKGRGGYCFEQNRLFGDALTALGIANRPMLARVRLGMPDDIVPPRTHVCLRVELEEGIFLADAGFGGSMVPPLPLFDGAEARTPDGARHRLRAQKGGGSVDGEWLLERAGPVLATDGRAAAHGDWQKQYSFELNEAAADDLEQANHWTATRPDTRFTTLHVASIPLRDGFASMVDRDLTVYRAGDDEHRRIADASDYVETLRDLFRIALPIEDAQRLRLFA